MADPATCPPLTRESVMAAHALIKPYIHRTPVLTNRTLTALASRPRTAEELSGTRWADRAGDPARPVIRLWFKCENFQRIGAFKARGAFHAVERLKMIPGWLEGPGKNGVVTGSSGNHAQALALAARTAGIPAHIVMPTISTPAKIAATRELGASVHFSGSTSHEREAVAARVVAETGGTYVPPYDHPDIILGQGTLGLELQEQVEGLMMMAGGGQEGEESGELFLRKAPVLGGENGVTAARAEKKRKEGRPALDAVIAPCSGGGMLSGVALSCEGTGIQVFAAEPEFEGADDCKRSLEQGRRIDVVKSLTIADGLRTPVGKIPWSVIYERRLVRQGFNVTEGEIRDALGLVLERFKLVVEPSAVVGLAVALYNEDFRRMVEVEAGEEGWDLGVVLSGGNVSLEALGKLFQEG